MFEKLERLFCCYCISCFLLSFICQGVIYLNVTNVTTMLHLPRSADCGDVLVDGSPGVVQCWGLQDDPRRPHCKINCYISICGHIIQYEIYFYHNKNIPKCSQTLKEVVLQKKLLPFGHCTKRGGCGSTGIQKL